MIITHWSPHDIQVFDSTKTDGTHGVALISVGSGNGTGIAAPFNIPCYLAGTMQGEIKKYSAAGNVYIGQVSTGLSKVKSLFLVPDTTLAAFGVNEAVLGLLDYSGMALH